jgi:S-adenosylmethionine hydrolase
MKGVILSINPTATIVDITHDIQPQHIRQAGYLLWSAYRYFPPPTIFVSVIDPGVGSKRRILGVKTPQGIFLAPDNMLLDFLLAEEPVLEAVEIPQTGSPFTLQKISSTFHGRDIFAPVAAHLSRGTKLRKLGTPIAVHRPPSPLILVGTQRTPTATVLHIDRFGNIVTNLRAKDFDAAQRYLRRVVVHTKSVSVWSKTFADAPAHKPALTLGSSGVVEIIVKNGSAARLLRATLDQTLGVQWR